MANALLNGIKKKVPTDRHYRSLMKRMLLVGFFLPFLPMVLIGGIIMYQFDSAYKGHVYAHLTAAAKNGKRNLDRFLNDKTASLQWIAQSLDPATLTDTARLTKVLAAFQDRPFAALAVLDVSGSVLAATGTDGFGATLRGTPGWLGTVLTSGRVSTVTGKAAGQVVIAIRQGPPEAPQVLAASLDSMDLAGSLKAFAETQTISAFLLTRQGVSLIGGETGIPGQGGVLLTTLPDLPEGDDRPVVQRHRAVTGTEYLYAVSRPTWADWVLVYRQPVSEAFAGLTRAKRLTGTLVALVGLLLAFYALGLSRKTVETIEESDRKKQKMNEKMFQTAKLASIGELAAGIAHEINNPVAIMVEEAGWVEDLLEEQDIQEAEDRAEFGRALKQIQTQGQRCKAITHKLLSFARKTDFRLQKVKLKELIEDIVTISSKRSRCDGITIRLDIQKDLPEFMLPPTELQQVLLNLLNNAIDAMETKGGAIAITARSEGGDLFIEVSDNGPGIPKGDLARVFDPFFTTKPVGKGTGLGLSICYGIVKRIGGDIRVHSVTGEGTTFRIRIPALVAEDCAPCGIRETGTYGPEAAPASNGI